jgi:hypothetical protein
VPAPVPCHFCNKLIAQDVEGRWHATHTADKAPWVCYSPSGHRPPVPEDLLNKGQRWQVGEARDLLASWDLARGGDGIFGTERMLTDALRGMLALLDQVAPEPKGGGKR